MPSLTPESSSTEPARRSKSQWSLIRDRFLRDRLALGGLVLVGLLFVAAIAAPLIANDKPFLQSVGDRINSPAWSGLFEPSTGQERLLDRVYNFVLVFTLAFLLILWPGYGVLRLAGVKKGKWRWWVFGVATYLIASLFFCDVAFDLIGAVFMPLLHGGRAASRFTREWFVFLCFLVVIVGPLYVILRVAGVRTSKAVVVALALVVLPGTLLLRGPARLDKTNYRQLAAKARAEGRGWFLFAPVPFGPKDQPRKPGPLKRPSGEHIFGTDEVGRDVFARLVYGARVSLSVGFVAVTIYVTIGVIIGSIAAFYGGWVDIFISRAIEIVMCFPTFLLILTIVALVENRSILNIMLIIGLTGWTGVARLVRGQMLQQKRMDYVTAARALGMKDARIIFRHVLPNSVAPVFVAATFGVASAILTESGLSFLGVGVQPPTPSWGELLTQARAGVAQYWWLTLWPGVMIFVTVTIYNLVGEGLRDAMDPRQRS